MIQLLHNFNEQRNTLNVSKGILIRYYKFMLRKNIFLTILTIALAGQVSSQAPASGFIEGRIFNSKNNEPVPFANIVIWGTTIGSVSDIDGRFLFTGIKPGYVELRVSSVGYKTYVSEQLLVTNTNKVFIDVPLEETTVAAPQAAFPAEDETETPVPADEGRVGLAFHPEHLNAGGLCRAVGGAGLVRGQNSLDPTISPKTLTGFGRGGGCALAPSTTGAFGNP